MVHIIDEGSVFDLTLDKLWEYLPSDAHKHSSQNVISREFDGNTLTIVSERDVDETIVRSKLKITMFPPLGVVQEYLEGPAAGSKVFTYYSPKGSKTAVTVVGDFKIEGATDRAATRRAVLKMLGLSFKEDTATIKKSKSLTHVSDDGQKEREVASIPQEGETGDTAEEGALEDSPLGVM